MFSLNSQGISEIRQQMLKFAQLQLHDPDLAEDVVQEALASAYKNANSFRGKSALKTWIFAILKHKIIDLIQSRKRTITLSEMGDEIDPECFFDQTGHWAVNEIKEWQDVEQITYQKEFWAIFDLCLNKLSGQQARVFMMKEYLELPREQICNECGISATNLNVMLYRARLQLHACLARNWFEGEV
ncbi:RNA polymerase subunit sigma [Pasteurellaceae bacterium Macca]|nr:RNA polymerase subunit sigma [Pasteurellaceae bacterium Macca]